MVNFKIPTFLFAFASCAVASAFPRDNLAPRDIASPVFDERNVIARGEIAVPGPAHELVARQIVTDVQGRVIDVIGVFVNASLPLVGNIETACANKAATTAQVAAIININLTAIIVLLKVLLAALQVIAALKIQITITAVLKVALTALLSIFVKVCLAVYLRLNIDLAALLKLIIGSITIWLDLWVQICIVLKLIIIGLGPILIEICATLGLTAAIAAALGWQKLQGCYY